MTLADPSFPSSPAFDAITTALSNEAARSEALRSGGGALFVFTLTNASGAHQSWYIDLREQPATTTTSSSSSSRPIVGKGTGPEGAKAHVTLIVKDEDFGKLVRGKAQAQMLFMTGALRIRGDLMKATKAEAILKNAKEHIDTSASDPPKAKL